MCWPIIGGIYRDDAKGSHRVGGGEDDMVWLVSRLSAMWVACDATFVG